jgi:hypothetical protein
MEVVPFGIGAGIVAYGGAVAFYTLLALWRLRRAALKHTQRVESLARKEELLAAVCVPEDAAGK